MLKKRINQLLAIGLSCMASLNLFAQTLPGTYSTTWSGNTFSGNPNWVQGYMLSAAVSPTGKVFTIAHWDEAGKTCGIYQDGAAAGRINASGFAITANSTHVFTQGGSSVNKYNFSGSSASQSIGLSFTPSHIAANETYLVASNNGGNEVAIYNLSNGQQAKKWSVYKPGPVAIDSNNNIWVVSGVQLPEDRFERKWLVYDTAYLPRIHKYSNLGILQPDSILLYDEWRPVCLAMDLNTNQLMVGDDGPKHQVHFFDISTTPVLANSFGTEGGLGNGIITPTKFWALKGIGTDIDGNIYVVIGEDGSVIRSLKPDGQLNWELNAANFVDVMNFDPYSDGRFLYGKNEIIKMDYNKTSPGTEWSMYAYTQDRTKYPNDPRNFYTALGHEFTSVWPRIIEGEMYMFTAGMYGVKPHVFKFTDKVASPAAELDLVSSSAFFQDKNGNVWGAADGIFVTPLMAIEKNGDLIYGKAEKVSNIPAPLSSVSRIIFDEENDVMYLTGENNKLARYDNWSTGNRVAKFVGTIATGYNQSVAVAGDYIFTCGVQTKSQIKVYSAINFAYQGMLEAGVEVGGVGNTGWVDIPYGLNAIKRLNGEYIIAIEDDYKMKSVIFRWCPDGPCKQGEPMVQFNGLVNKTSILPGDSLLIDVSAQDANGTIDSIKVYADDLLVASSISNTLTFNWKDIPEGKYYLLAKAWDNDRLQSTTYPVRIYVVVPDTIAPVAPYDLKVKDTATTYVNLIWRQSSDNENLAGYKILRDDKVAYVSGGLDTTYIAKGLLPNTNYNFAVVAFDKSLNFSDTSNTITISTKSDGPYSGAPMPIPGKIEMEYFDYGGEGVAYHDADVEHIGNSFRDDESVDIGYSSAQGSYHLGWTEVDEWLRYTVNVAVDGDYDVIMPTAGGSGSLLLTFSNGDNSYTINYSNTPDWDIWKTASKTNIHLLAGVQYFTVKLNNQQVNLDYINIIEHQTENIQVPNNLVIDTIIQNAVTLKWQIEGDAINIREYKVYRNGTFLEVSTNKTYAAKNLVAGQSYNFSVSSVSLVGLESEKSNVVSVTLPSVVITSPANNAEFDLGSDIQIDANATDDGQITKVDFYANNTLLGTDTEAPYSFVLVNPAVGTYNLKAKAYDDTYLFAESAVINVKIVGITNVIGQLNEKDLVSIYPNPVRNGILNVALQNGEMAIVSMYNITGKLIYQSDFSSNVHQISTLMLNSGMYIVRVSTENEVCNQKVVVK